VFVLVLEVEFWGVDSDLGLDLAMIGAVRRGMLSPGLEEEWCKAVRFALLVSIGLHFQQDRSRIVYLGPAEINRGV